ncbi:MAG: methyltransferase domain-containing protein [Clostridia bacterium]|nr:methyltransferase domain-containing protein [Clostridia bacterium]
MNFDDFYSRKYSYFSEEHSGGMEECLIEYKVNPCSAVDLGAGEGRNSLFLASLGFNVTAIEPSKIGAKKIELRAQESGIPLTVINNDFLSASGKLSDIGFLVALTSLDHMEFGYICKTINEIKRIIKPGGYVYIMVFTEDDPGFKKDLDNASECSLFIKHYFKKNELKKFFDDFEILKYAEYIKVDELHGPKHYHGKAKLFARKLL